MAQLSKLSDGEQTALIETGTFTVSIRKEGNKYFVRCVKSAHNVNGTLYGFELKEESDGTQRIFDFVPMLQEVKSKDETYVIDEIDRSLHPSLVRALVTLILSDANMKGQLIFTTHDAGCLTENCSETMRYGLRKKTGNHRRLIYIHWMSSSHELTWI